VVSQLTLGGILVAARRPGWQVDHRRKRRIGGVHWDGANHGISFGESDNYLIGACDACPSAQG
jgi:hypothetical protein